MPTPANALDITSAGIVKFDGTATFSSTTTTQFNLLVGGTSNAIVNVAPSATSGVPVISQGSSSNPTFGTAVVAGGGTGDTSFTAYSVICGGTTSTGALQNVSGVGTSGQVLTSNGASALPSWQTFSNNLVLLSTQNASNSASISFTSLISSTYNDYFFIFSNVVPITNTSVLQMQFSINNGSTYISANYESGTLRNPYNSTTFTNTNSTSLMLITQGLSSTSSNCPAGGYIYLFNMQNSGVPVIQGANAFYGTTDALLDRNSIVAINTANTNINAFNLSMNSGNISTGTFSLYGILE